MILVLLDLEASNLIYESLTVFLSYKSNIFQ